MTRTATIIKAMQGILLATALTPATVNAEPLSTRQMLAQAQLLSQNQAVKDEVKRIDRGLIGSPAEAATHGTAQRPVEIPPVSAPEVTAPTEPAPGPRVEMAKAEIPALLTPKIETPPSTTTNNNLETAGAAPALIQRPSIVTLPTAVQPTAEIVPSVQSASVETVGAVTSPPPATAVKPEPSAQTTGAAATSSVESIKPRIVTKIDAAKAKPAAKNNTSTKAANTQSSNQHRTSSRGDDSFTVNGFTISGPNGGQLTKLINRPEVKSILAQYGLN